MNEITQIHLGRQAFTIANDAHKELQEYLHAIEKRVGKKGEEVVKEVENRMAELLAERGVTGEKVVLLEDVKFLKEQLGSPKDFTDKDEDADGDDADESTDDDQGQKRLFRDTDRGFIAGVAAGLASYFNVDPVFVRIGFVVLTLFWGWGILVYILLWLIVPEAKSSSNRLQMKGKAVTVETLKEAVHKADVPGAANRVGTVFGRVLKSVGKVLLAIIGISFLLAGSLQFLATMAAGIMLLTSGTQSYGEVIFPIGATENWIVICGMIASGAMSVLLMLMGWAMVRRKWPLAGWASVALIAVFLAGSSIAVGLMADRASDIARRTDKLLHHQEVSTQAFKKVDLTGTQTRFKYVPSDTYRVELQYMGKQHFETSEIVRVDADKLLIDASSLLQDSGCKIFCIGEERWLEVTIFAPTIEELNIDGLSTFTSDKPLSTNTALLVGDGATVNLLGISPAETNVEIATISPVTTVRLVGNRPSGPHGMVSVSPGLVQIGGTDVLRLDTPYGCFWSSPTVHLDQMPKQVIINGGQPITAEAELELSKTETSSINNCVSVRPTMPIYYY